jgi:hypothetical protein
MSFSGRTPESLLPRSDSKNPATTCKGLTASGRPCRRALAASPRSSPAASPLRNGHGVLAVLDQNDAAAFYCWQHKDQAESLAAQAEQRTTLYSLKERSSIDTLAEQVGVIDLDSEVSSRRKKKRRSHGQEPSLTKRDTLPPGWHDMQGPLMTVPEEYAKPKPRRRKEHSYGRSNVRATWTCCIQADDDEAPAKPTALSRPDGGYTSPAPMQLPASHPSSDIRRKPVPSSSPSRPGPLPHLAANQPSSAQSNSQTQALLSLIPPHLSPQTTSLLLSELSKPISPSDEAGYIYIFWLTPDSADKPDEETATSIIDDSDSSDDDRPTPARSRGLKDHPSHQRRQSEALRRYASVRVAPVEATPDKRTILLKIGRAANVHRRMSQWTKQCGQDITLVRYYPYQAPSSSSGSSATRCPHIHRVERLIHLELADQRVTSEPCAACGREHKEWFEIAANRKGLRSVDKAIKRWVRWAQAQDVHGGLPVMLQTPDRARLRPVDGYY